MPKSYEPIQPKGKKRPPTWTEQEGTRRVSEVVTDDTEFPRGFYRPSEAGNVVFFCYQQRGRWFTVTIQRKRIKRAPTER